MIKNVYLVFKTHLDVGYTDFSENVIRKYLEDYIPKAIETAYASKGSKTEYIWTVGSWLIDLALKQDTDGRVEQAVRDGCLSWHALPLTTHTEMMNEQAFRLLLKSSRNLDQRFGVNTIAAKMTDVPGHTMGMIPLLAEYGVRFLHIGVNPATPMPPVPDLFRWKCGDDSVTVMYNKDYGDFMEFEDFAVGFGFTGDNNGPVDIETLKKCYRQVQAKYPRARIHAATLNDVARLVDSMDLPVIEKEIGDTWIHGLGTDPWKLAGYRALQRNIEQFADRDISQNLIMVPEHTWGLNVRTEFPDCTNWELKNFEKVKTPERERMEQSWLEQRMYVKRAAELIDFDLMAELRVEYPDLDGFAETEGTPDFEVSYQLFDNNNYRNYVRTYLRPEIFENGNDVWALSDFTKPGLPEYQGGTYPAQVVQTWQKEDTFIYKLSFPENIRHEQGVPELIAISAPGSFELRWFGKKANRLPQAFWLKFKGLEEKWELHKMGKWIDAENVLGSPLIVGVDQGVRNRNLQIVTLDSALVAPFGRRLLEYDVEKKKQDLYFNLYNNIWNTNFPMWYSDDARFRFRLRIRGGQTTGCNQIC